MQLHRTRVAALCCCELQVFVRSTDCFSDAFRPSQGLTGPKELSVFLGSARGQSFQLQEPWFPCMATVSRGWLCLACPARVSPAAIPAQHLGGCTSPGPEFQERAEQWPGCALRVFDSSLTGKGLIIHFVCVAARRDQGQALGLLWA